MTVASILELHNHHLLRDIDRLKQEVSKAHVLEELAPYMERVIALCDLAREQIQRNLSDVALGRVSILEDILSSTQQASQIVRLLSSKMATPILRCSPSDRLLIRFLRWMHSQHQNVARFPAVFMDGDCSMWPFLGLCPIYFFPAAEQRILLYLPLCFHEFGHLLYRLHEQELNALVQKLQQEVDEVLRPPSQRNDDYMVWQKSQRELIVTTWYKWTQELLCDAVGLRIGGPAFLWAFSTYLGTFERGDFYRDPAELERSEHPVSMLRIRVLTERANHLGLSRAANGVMEEWKSIADVMNVSEDYHGFYDDRIFATIEKTLDDMLIEVSPRPFISDEIEIESKEVHQDDSPIKLVHKAWDKFFSSSPDEYNLWERKAIESWLS
jgi:hypothetical protein